MTPGSAAKKPLAQGGPDPEKEDRVMLKETACPVFITATISSTTPSA